MKLNSLYTNNFFLFVLCIWFILVGCGYVKDYYNIIVIQNIEVSSYYLLIRSIVKWAVIPFFIYGVIYLNFKAPINEAYPKNLLLHFGLLVIAMLAIAGWSSYVYYWIRSDFDLPNAYSTYLVYGVNLRLELLVLPFLHTFILVGQWVLSSYKKKIEDQTLSFRKKNNLLESRLNILKAKIDPHFLLNTLQGVSSLAYENRDSAYQMLLALKDLYLEVENRSGQLFVPLQNEVNFNRKYLYLEKLRFKNKLWIDFNIDDNISKKLVPNFILQPLIENSLKHVVSKSLETTLIKIEITCEDEFVCLSVEDSGCQNDNLEHKIHELKKGELGFGLRNISKRLSMIGNGATLVFSKSKLGGLNSKIIIPNNI